MPIDLLVYSLRSRASAWFDSNYSLFGQISLDSEATLFTITSWWVHVKSEWCVDSDEANNNARVQFSQVLILSVLALDSYISSTCYVFDHVLHNLVKQDLLTHPPIWWGRTLGFFLNRFHAEAAEPNSYVIG